MVLRFGLQQAALAIAGFRSIYADILKGIVRLLFKLFSKKPDIMATELHNQKRQDIHELQILQQISWKIKRMLCLLEGLGLAVSPPKFLLF